MANTSLIKRSSVASKVPTTSDLSLGELAVNTYDGKLFLKKSVSGTESIVDLTDADTLDGQHGSYYTGYTDTAIANLIDSAPNALNTLNELSAALNDDASFSTTITNSIATKMPLAGGQFTGDVTFNSGANAILIAANSDIRFANGSNWTGDVTGKIQLFNNTFYISGGTGGIIFREGGTSRWRIDGDGHFIPINGDGLLDIGTNTVRVRNGYFDNLYGNGSNLTNIPAAQLTGVLPALDGSNLTGLTVDNAQTLDNLDSTQFVRSDANDTTTGTLAFTTPSAFPVNINGSHDAKIHLQGSNNPYIQFTESTSYNRAYIQWSSSADTLIIANEQSGEQIKLGSGNNGLEYRVDNANQSIFHQGNDGSGSGLDSDTVDGLQASAFLGVNATAAEASALDIVDTRNDGARVPNDYASQRVTSEFTNQVINGWWSAITAKGWANGYAPWQLWGKSDTGQDTNLYVRFGHGSNNTWSSLYKIFHTGSDGSGSTLDADTLDGVEGSSFLRSDAEDTITAPLVVNAGTANAANDATLYITASNNNDWGIRLNNYNNSATEYGARIEVGSSANYALQIVGNGSEVFRVTGAGTVYANGNGVVFHTNNDGSGSGLDSDTLDGIQAAKFLTSYSSSSTTGWEDSNRNFRVTTGGDAAGLVFHTSNNTFAWQLYGNQSGQYGFLDGNWNSWDIQKTVNGQFKVDEGSGLARVWNANNDGAGSGLDSDTLDGVQGSSFLRSDAADTASGDITFSGGSGAITLAANSDITFGTSGSWSGEKVKLQHHANTLYMQGGTNGINLRGIDGGTIAEFKDTSIRFYDPLTITDEDIRSNGTSNWTGNPGNDVGKIQMHSNRWYIVANGNSNRLLQLRQNGTDKSWFANDGQLYHGDNSTNDKYWRQGNDGSGSTLDSDKLDGQEGSYYTNAGNLNAGSISADRIADGSITNAKLATGIDGDKILNLTIDSTELENNCIITDKITNSAVTNAKISSMDASKLTGTVAAARLGTSSTSEHGVSAVGNFGQYENHGTYTNFNTEPAFWGWNYVTGNTNAPNTSSSQWYRCRLSLGASYGKGSDANDYCLEMAIPRSSPSSAGGLHLRTIENGNESSWHEVASKVGNSTVFHQNNDGSGSNLDADTLDGTQANSLVRSGSQSSVSGWHISAYRNGSGTSPHIYMSHSSGYGFHVNTYNTSGSYYAIETHNGTKTTFVVWNDGRCQHGGNVEPNVGSQYDLGNSSNRWRNLYINDLQLSNEGGANDVDGTWGSYTIQEGKDSLYLLNKRNGKKYKFNLTEVS